MAKKIVSKTKSSTTEIGGGETQLTASTSNCVFPPVGLKETLHCHVLETDQIILIPDVFTVEECKQYVKFIEELPLELTPSPKKGEADRVNYRKSIASTAFARTLFSVLATHFPVFPYPTSSAKRARSTGPRHAHSLNSNIRLYKYTATQHFGPHYDESVRDAETATKSEWTLLIYLSGKEDGVEGGETVFYKGQGRNRQEIRAPLHRGMALLHRHGHECLLHEGSPVLKGIKYVLRSDVMFMS